ncbi:MAG: hypothetical protein IJS47_04400 [Clostridia bacterium]|nr:hypothetical protein [Clostridia bacterium]
MELIDFAILAILVFAFSIPVTGLMVLEHKQTCNERRAREKKEEEKWNSKN